MLSHFWYATSESLAHVRVLAAGGHWGGAGFGAYMNVGQKGQRPEDKMESFFMAETLK